MSYLTTQSSSSSLKENTDAERIKLLKSQLTAIPSGLLHLSATTRGKKSHALKRKALVAKSYNVVAGRPLADRMNRMQEYVIHGRVDGTLVTSSASVPTFGSVNFTLNNVANSAIYTSCFDQYRFDEIEVWIEPAQGPASVPSDVGILASTVDLDDSTTPTSFGVVESAQGALVTSSFAGHYHKFQPHMAVAVYSGAFTSFANAPADWIDVASGSVQHYGIKAAISGTTTVSTWRYEMRCKISFRQTL